LLVSSFFVGVSNQTTVKAIDEENWEKQVALLIDPLDEGWNKTFGGSGYEEGWSVDQTEDGGYILTGETTSYGATASSVWLIKTDSSGNEQWNRTFGENEGFHKGWAVQQTTDNGYIIAAEEWPTGSETSDGMLIKIDSSGNEEWTRFFSGPYDDGCFDAKESNDGGYIVTGFTESYEGLWDLWLIKTDSDGNLTWARTFGGEDYEEGQSVQQTLDGGYIVTGSAQSYTPGWDYDLWLIKTDSLGIEEWNKTFGGDWADRGRCVQQTADDGYIIAGVTVLYGAGWADVWVVKVDGYGNEQWNKTFGGVDWDSGFSVKQTSYGGYIITGEIGADEFGFHAGIYLIKIDGNGNEEWNKTFGGTETDKGRSVQQTTDGGYIIAGYTDSYGAGNYDVWLIKVAPFDNQVPNAPIVDGAIIGKIREKYEYTFNTIDPDGDNIKYFIDWEDGKTEWTDFHASGTDVRINHTWSKKGTYTIKAKAKDIHGAQSRWGELEITMPKNKLFNFNVYLQNRLFDRFPNAFPILRHLLGL